MYYLLVVYLTTLSAAETVMSSDRMSNGLKSVTEGSGRGQV
jgi:hypothetical protein